MEEICSGDPEPGMKITYLLTQNLESPYGVGRCWPLARELTRLGHQIRILALHPDLDSVQQQELIVDGVQIQYVAPMHVIKKGNIKDYYPTHKLFGITVLATIKLTRAALRNPTDILHICKPHPMNSIAGLIAGRVKSHILFLDCDDYEAGSGNFSAGWQRLIVKQFERQVPKLVNTVTTNTHFMYQNLLDWGVSRDHLVFLPNGVDQDRFNNSVKSCSTTLQNLLELDGKPVIGYIGSLSLANHAVDLLIQAFSQISQIVPDARLLIVGTGEDLNLLQTLARQLGINNTVHWIGKVAPELVPMYYRLCHVSVDPVRNDDATRGRSPLKLFESWACQVPFVTGDVGDRKLLLGTPPAGLLAIPDSAESLAENILKVLQNPNLANELRAYGQERAKNYTWDCLAAQLSDIYQSTWETLRSERPSS